MCMLPLALLTLPGLVLYSRIRRQFSLPELLASSIALSVILIPLAAMLSRPLGVPPAAPLALFAALLLFRRGGKLKLSKKHIAPLLSALFFAALVLFVLAPYFMGATVQATHAGDSVWHLSNARWYSLSPQFPPEDSYSPGRAINADWLFTVLLGETEIHTLFALAAFALFLFVYLIAERLFRSGLAAAWLYMAFAGASWLLPASDIFQQLIFSPLGFKFDPTLLFFFLPQPQAIGLLLMSFILFLFLERRHALMGIVLGVLVGFHVQTAAVLLIAFLFRHERRFFPYFIASSAPFIFPLLSFHGAPFLVSFQPAALLTFSLTLLPLVPFAWPRRNTPFLPLLAILSATLAFLVAIPITQNGYRFLAYAAMPLAILASPSLKNLLPLLLALALTISSLSLAAFYTTGHYQQAAPSELPALNWIKHNTPRGAIVLEAYSLFPRVPYLAQRRILYGGQYGPQYHGYDGRRLVESITNETNATRLKQKLKGIGYILLGERERKLPFAQALGNFSQPFPGVIRLSPSP